MKSWAQTGLRGAFNRVSTELCDYYLALCHLQMLRRNDSYMGKIQGKFW